MLALALIPGLVLLFVVWKLDKVEKESPALILKLLGAGVVVMLIDILLRTIGLWLLESSYSGTSIMLYTFIDAFIFTALIEEGGRFLALKLLTWKNPEFNYTFDAIVYSVAVSVGFLVAENVVYVIKYGSFLRPIELVLPVFAQVVISVFMGYYYGLAKVAEGKKETEDSKKYMIEAVVVPTVIHGIYEMCVKTQNTVVMILFTVYIVFMTVAAVVIFRNSRNADSEIPWGNTDIKEGDEFEINVTDLLHKSDKAGKEADNEG
ncbi:MAG: PrsW family intramembrane metalloprotease [Lachnospiraceae bacterium]|nr:PrsW family intramembrane metalloprotease [Lachnospiraceae bacterium]